MIEPLKITRDTIETGQLEEFLAKVEKQGLLIRSSPEYRNKTREQAISQFNQTEDIWSV